MIRLARTCVVTRPCKDVGIDPVALEKSLRPQQCNHII
jgi:hypothetical protein